MIHKIKVFTVVLAISVIFSSCKKVSDDIPKEPFQTANTVLLTEEPSETVTVPSETEETADFEELVTESETASHSDTETETETAETSVKKKKQTTSFAETAASTGKSDTASDSSEVTTSETAAATTVTTVVELTIQSESPTETTAKKSKSYSALNYREQKGIWISYLEYSSAMMNKSESEFRKTIGGYFENVNSLGFNTVYVQVRAFGDAYYKSKLFPTGDRYNGTIGASLEYDPLKIMTEEAHSRDISLHAWINPMRLMTDSQMKKLSDNFTVKKWYNDSGKKGKYIVKSEDRWYLNPAYPEVEKLICAGIAEIVSGYDVDGIQIDDYFYPTTSASIDKAAYSSSCTDKSLSEWRISNINDMVARMNKTVHSVSSDVLFGISPQGSIDNNYNELYADVKTWCGSSLYCDYILPQVYFGFDNAALPYNDVIKLWSDMTSSGKVKLVIGLAGYKIGAVDNYAGSSGKNEWLNNSDIISKQIKKAETLDNYGGVAIFRYGSMFEPDSSVAKQVNAELKNIRK